MHNKIIEDDKEEKQLVWDYKMAGQNDKIFTIAKEGRNDDIKITVTIHNQN